MDTFFQLPDIETLHLYRPGGLHPVHLGDRFYDGRYEVLRKLGAGGYATVWLVRDHILGVFSALKILKADADGREIAILRRVQELNSDYIVRVLHIFEHVGPNGTHQCVVMEVLGPSIATVEDDLLYEDVYPSESFPLKVAQSMALQTARALEDLHRANIVHGDITKRNVLFFSPAIQTWTADDDLPKYSGAITVQTRPILMGTGNNDPAPPSIHRPAYVVHATSSQTLIDVCFADDDHVRVKLCDFGEAYFYDPPIPTQRRLHTPPSYCSPEILLHLPVSPAADVWALGVLFHDLISAGSPLFLGIRKREPDFVLVGMVLRRGKLPDAVWPAWNTRGTYFDEDGAWIGAQADMPSAIEPGMPVSARIYKYLYPGEMTQFEGLIRRMTDFDAHTRASIQECVELLSNLWPADPSGVVEADPFTNSTPAQHVDKSQAASQH
ncbi:kinase-like protein [Exidia glandulosa HHB12029]|uniref:Kinase-like protein n=1 Tax=Exidia glandulosa HHB12029 TaxID=1314781 RepID=A0A165IX67_EXIGL|nr:kinase-like protein [Exidia glandulosa HHB12029]